MSFRLSWSFFAQPSCDLKVLEEHVFALVYYGKGGFTHEACWSMYIDEMLRSVKKLKETLEEEARVQREANKKNQQQQRSAANRRRG